MGSGESSKRVTQGRLSRNQLHRLRKLLYMKYRPSELAEELGISKRQIYSVYLPLGCPHERDSRRHIWIVGTEFKDWYQETYRKRKHAKNQAYCVCSKNIVQIVNPQEKTKDRLTYLIFSCPNCGKTTTKIQTMRRRKQ